MFNSQENIKKRQDTTKVDPFDLKPPNIKREKLIRLSMIKPLKMTAEKAKKGKLMLPSLYEADEVLRWYKRTLHIN